MHLKPLLLPFLFHPTLSTPMVDENPCSATFHLYCCVSISSSAFEPCEDRMLSENDTMTTCLKEDPYEGRDFSKGYACCINDDVCIRLLLWFTAMLYHSASRSRDTREGLYCM